MKESANKWLSQNKAHADWLGLRLQSENGVTLQLRNERREHQEIYSDAGFMLEVLKDGFLVYVGGADLTESGFDQALKIALERIRSCKEHNLLAFQKEWRPDSKGEFTSPSQKTLRDLNIGDLEAFGIDLTKALNVHGDIVTRAAFLWAAEMEQRLLSSSGRDIVQKFSYNTVSGEAVAYRDGQTQVRSINGRLSNSFQSGAELFSEKDWSTLAKQAGEEALELLSAQDCPEEEMDLLLAPDQMMLQIHESIGHPLELDRILGDERNYAGWSFVQPEDFGSLQYGSKLMNVSFDPTQNGQLASYEFDDSGNPAKKVYLIKEGVLQTGLGSLESQARLGISGTANFRSSGWNRAPIDRMANINLEPGENSLNEMISQVERGVWMTSNRSWSIDDYRNKFQFGCEYAKLIENGKMTKTLKNPNYRGVTNQFWRSLKAVGSGDTYRQYGTPYCGKGEPNQVIRVSHGSPACLFENISVFGGGR